MRSHRGRMVAFVLLAICAQIARNWLMLRGIGVHVSLLDAIALLITMFTLGQLPIGPTLGPAAAGADPRLARSRGGGRAGVLLTITSIVGSLCYATWALADRFGGRRPLLSPEPARKPRGRVTAIPS